MSRTKAVLLLDPNRIEEQRAYIAERAENIFEIGDRLFASITEEQVPRFLEQGIHVQLDPDADLVEVPAATFDPLASEVLVPDSLRAPAPGGESVHHVVQFHAPADPSWIGEIAELGGSLVEDLPVHAGIFRLTGDQASAVRALAFVRWVEPYHPAFAMSYSLTDSEERPFVSDLRAVTPAGSRFASTPIGAFEATFFADVTSASMHPRLEAAGAVVVIDTGRSIHFNAPEGALGALLRVEGVKAVEPNSAKEPGVARASIITQVNQVRDLGVSNFLINLDGTGEIVGVYDTGLDAGGPPAAMHPDFGARVLSVLNANAVANPTADTWPHGTLVTGIIAGAGTQSIAAPVAVPNPTRAIGVAPAAQIVFQSVNGPAPPALGYGTFYAAWLNSHQRGARVINCSHGEVNGPVTNNAYTAGDSTGADQFSFLNPDTLVVVITQNDEQDANGNGILDQNRLTAWSAAKNVLAVGATENVTNLEGTPATYLAGFPGGNYVHANFAIPAGPPPVAGNFPQSDNPDDVVLWSKRGQVAAFAPGKRRIKPDIVAPGTNILSTGPRAMLPMVAPAVAVTAPPAFYYVASGTSFAAPQVAGAAVLARQYYRTLYGRLRRPQLLQALPDGLIDEPSIAPHVLGWVAAWIRRDAGAGQNHVMAARFNASFVRQGDRVQIATDVGDHPAPMVARHGEATVLLHRHGDNSVRVSLLDRDLLPLPAFGGGTVTLAPLSRAEDDRSPALAVEGDTVSVVWNETGTNNLLFRQIPTGTGVPSGAAAVTIGQVTRLSTHPYLVHNGDAYFAVFIHHDGPNWKLLFRKISNAGVPDGAAPVVLVSQPAELHDAHLAWDARQSRFLVTWVDSTRQPRGDVNMRRFRADGTADGAVESLPSIAAGRTARNPFVAAHPESGWVSLWEDDSEGAAPGGFDVYTTFLFLDGHTDLRVTVGEERISDTPNATHGFAGLGTPEGLVALWMSTDEINSDQPGVFSVLLTGDGRFLSQVDPNVPLLREGKYVSHLLSDHVAPGRTAISAVWAGGDVYVLQETPTVLSVDTNIVRLNPDGLPDTIFGGGGARRLVDSPGHLHLEAHWAGNRMVASLFSGATVDLMMMDASGVVQAGFGVAGFRTIPEVSNPAIFPQMAQRGVAANHRILVVYGQDGAPQPRVRYLVLNQTGGAVVGPINLPDAVGGTARHGWFQWAESENPRRSIAAWHQIPVPVGPITVFLNRFDILGAKQHAAPIRLTALPGESRNAVIAPRPALVPTVFPLPAAPPAPTPHPLRQREYGIAWQNQPVAGQWEIRFSRLNRDGTVHATHDVAVVQKAGVDATHPQLVWHTDGFGLAWLEQAAGGGNHSLFFTILDQNGAHADLAPLGGPVSLVHDFRVSHFDSDVQEFQLIWTGRSFRVVWTELKDGRLRQMQRSLIVPRQPNMVDGFDEPFQHPTSALIRATLINGATNIGARALPSVGNLNNGYGWGRLNLRQALAPAAPVTFHARHDASVAAGRTVHYRFFVPPEAQLLRVCLVWTDPPGNAIINDLHLRVTVPAGAALPSRIFVGNRWQAGAPQFSDPLPPVPPAGVFNDIHPIEMVVVQGVPTLPSGVYDVEVIGGTFAGSIFQQFPGQPFGLVFVASGPEMRFPAGGAPPPALPVY